MFLDAAGNVVREASLYGYRAAGVPGTVMGLDRALALHGRLGRAAVMAPAIALAREGFVLGPADAGILAARATRLAADPETARSSCGRMARRTRPATDWCSPTSRQL